MSVAVRLVTNYEKISRQGTATILLSKHINCIAFDKILIGMKLYLADSTYVFSIFCYLKFSFIMTYNCNENIANFNFRRFTYPA